MNRFTSLAPGLLLCAAVTGIAYAVEAVEHVLFGRSWLEALVLAIVIGTVVRSLRTPHTRWLPGIGFSGRYLLEAAVVLLGLSLDAASILTMAGRSSLASPPWS